MGVMVEVGAGGHDPIHESHFDQRDERRDTQAGRRQCARKSHAYCDIFVEHLLSKKVARLSQSSSVVRTKHLINQFRNLELRMNWLRIDSLPSKKWILLIHEFSCLRPNKVGV